MKRDADIYETPNGRHQYRWREGGRRRARTFDRKTEARAFKIATRRRIQLGGVVELAQDDPTLREFVRTYWREHAIPNLRESTRDLYRRTWHNHLLSRVGDLTLRELTPGRVLSVQNGLLAAGVGEPTVRKAMGVLQSIYSFAVLTVDGIDTNPVAAVKKPPAETTREPHIFTPVEVEAIRARLGLRDAALVAVLAYAGPRPEEALRLRWADVGQNALHFRDTKRRRDRHPPLLASLREDLNALYLAAGRPDRTVPVFPNTAGGHWSRASWRSWRRRVWQHDWRADPRNPRALDPLTPSGSRPRDLRSSYVTVMLYAGEPLTTIARSCGTSVAMLDRHYAGVIANWNGERVAAEAQIRAARGGELEVVAG